MNSGQFASWAFPPRLRLVLELRKQTTWPLRKVPSISEESVQDFFHEKKKEKKKKSSRREHILFF